MTEITVSKTGGEKDKTTFNVVVSDDKSATRHTVTLPTTYWQKYSQRYPNQEDFIQASFEFLLEREPKESILKHFEVPVIAQYFPEFKDQP